MTDDRLGFGEPVKLLNCPKCRLPLALYIQVCPACGVRVAELPSVDRPARETGETPAIPEERRGRGCDRGK
jgi:hypothetical protein